MRPPRSTYRVQIRPDFDFADTVELVDYLAALGVTHLYSAPLLQATPGSAHGYDVADPTQVNAELGGDAGRLALVAALREHGLGLVIDIVPNHAGVRVPAANPAWWDVLRQGPDSPYADWFDIDWSRGRLVLPILSDDSDALADLRVEDGELRYFEHRFPIAPGTAGTPATATATEAITAAEIHQRQHYELVSWRRGAEAINYRRFFAVSELAGLRVEDPEVFRATHAEVLRWYANGEVDGIRVDHPDGLRDPGGYLDRLSKAAPEAWLVVEKITEGEEPLPPWPVAGTTGYDALGEVCGLFVDAAGEPALTALDTELTGVRTDWPDLAHDCKLDVATGMLQAELGRLARLAPPDLPLAREALAELLACFPVYRSYLPYGAAHLADAAAEATRRRPDLAAAVSALLPRLEDPADELAVRFQQTSGAVMAKGVEDTAFYRWTRFIALNEVGGDPARFGVSVSRFHQACAHRQTHWPASMTTLSTHDTKRSEDVRARLAVLSELAPEWAAVVRRWSSAAPLPDPAFGHLLWQSVVGGWPLQADRLHAYLEKAAREARTSTGWDAPDEAFEAAMHGLADRIYSDPVVSAEVADFAAILAPFGWSNSLGQKVVQLTMPGIPDVYQGCELWDNSLVDPDNRRPVDFAARRKLLSRIDNGWSPPVGPDGAAKLLVTARALRLRRDRPELFSRYDPITALGSAAEHAVAFDRGGALTVATRLPARLAGRGGWAETALELPPGRWSDVFTSTTWSGRVQLRELLESYPVALLARAAT